MVSFDLGLGRKVVKCRKVIKYVVLAIRASSCIASRRARVEVEL
jgi:hypothetical protein